jgi:hypothetical protein
MTFRGTALYQRLIEPEYSV